MQQDDTEASTHEPQPYLVGYARVSTDDQNLQLQLDALIAAGVRPDDIHTDVASGKSMQRPGIQAALMALRRDDILVVWKLDRLSRKLEDILRIAKRIAEKGAHLRSTTQAIDTTTPTGRLIFHVFGVLAEFERDVGVERTKAGLASARARGRIGGRRMTFTLEQRDEALRLLSEGLTVREVAEKLGISRAVIYKWKGPNARP
jgi:DNA invertase Pin-like site-specific DNA recombinase